MSRDIYEKIDFRRLDFSFIYQCAPAISGLKISNLLIIKHNHIDSAYKLISKFGLHFFLLYETNDKVVFFVYNISKTVRYLENTKIKKFLHKRGHKSISLDDLLRKISIEYSGYMRNKSSFPDELGILLGYPIEDVQGYIKNNGKNYICNGYWKVYSEAEEKLKLFKTFDSITEKMIRLLILKHDISFLVDTYKAA